MTTPTPRRAGPQRALLPAIAVIVAVCGCAPAGADAADLSWSGVQQISSPNQPGSNPSLSVNDAGQGIIAWNEDDDAGKIRIRARYRLPGGFFGDPVGAYTDNSTVYVSVQSADSVAPTAVIGQDGNAMVAWLRPGVVRIASGNPDTGLGPAVAVSGADDAISGPALALDSRGNAILGYVRDVGGNPQVVARYKPAGGSWSSPEVVWDSSTTSAPGPGAVRAVGSLVAGMDEQGNAAFSWAFNSNQWNQDPFLREIRAAFRPAGGPWETAVQFPTQTRGNSPVRSAAPTEVAMRAGATIIAWNSDDASDSREHVNVRPAGGPWDTATETLSPVDPSNNNSGHYGSTALGIDPSGNALDIFSNFDTGGIYEAARAAGAATFSQRKQIVTSPPLKNPSFEFDSKGDAVFGWTANGATQYAGRAAAAVRSPGVDGTFGTPALVSAEGDLENVRPQLAVTGPGQAFAAWTRTAQPQPAPGNPNPLRTVEVSIGTPVDDPVVVPPPPPPPPPPPVPSPNGTIELARVAKSGEATVLTFKPSGPVTAVEWTIPGQPTVTGRVVGGRLQTSVRFRAVNRNTKVTVKASGPGGTKTIARTFTLPADPTGSTATEVLTALEKHKSSISKVVALSFSADALTGRSGCATTTVVSGGQSLTACFEPIDTSSEIPTAELGVLAPIAKALGLDRSRASLMQTAVGLLDGYITKSSLSTPSGFPLEPVSGASILFVPQAKTITSSSAGFRVGGDLIKRTNFQLNAQDLSKPMDLGAVAKLPSLPKIGGFDIGDFTMRLDNGQAVINGTLKLPSFLKVGGVSAQSSFTLRATPSSYIVDDVTIGPIAASLAGVGVEGLLVRYTRANQGWYGQGKACLPGGTCLDMIPDAGHVSFLNGEFDYAGATLNFPIPGVPLFPGVNMTHLGFGFGLNPTRLTATTHLKVAEFIGLKGNLLVAFPSAAAPYRLDPREVGTGFPAELYKTSFTRPTLGITAQISLELPVVGDTQLGGGYLLYEYPGYAAFGGGFDFDIGGIVYLKGGISGEVEATKGYFNLHGDVEGCVDLKVELCAGAVAHIGRGAGNSGGAGACVSAFGLSVGGGVIWRSSKPKIWPFDGCKWSIYRAVVRTRQADPSTPTTAGTALIDAGTAVQIDGSGDAPLVKVTAPDGTVTQSAPDSGLTISDDKKVRILRYAKADNTFTVVGVQAPASGKYKVEPAEGSVAVTGMAQAEDQPDAKITASVSGSGDTRTLAYDIAPRDDQVVTFLEKVPGGAARTIGRVTSSGKGKLEFKPAPGLGRHDITAQFELAGIPAETKVVAGFAPPSPRLAAPGVVKVRRTARGLQVRWLPVSGASRYEVVATVKGGGQKIVRSRKRTVLLRLGKTAAGAVSVRGLGDLRESGPRLRRFNAYARRPSATRRLPRCTKHGRRIVCR